MNPDRTLNATFWAMVAVQTIGAVDPVKGPRKMPSPRAYVAVVVLWTILHMVAEGSRSLARPAAALSGLVVLAAVVLSPAGKTLLAFLDTVSSTFRISPATGSTGGVSFAPPATTTGGVSA